MLSAVKLPGGKTALVVNGGGWRSWLIGALFAIALALAGMVLNSFAERIVAAEARANRIEQQQNANRERLAGVEEAVKTIKDSLKDIDNNVKKLLDRRDD